MASRVESIRWALDNHTEGIHPVRRSRRGGMAKVEEYAPVVARSVWNVRRGPWRPRIPTKKTELRLLSLTHKTKKYSGVTLNKATKSTIS